jgi:hypothetical protein
MTHADRRLGLLLPARRTRFDVSLARRTARFDLTALLGFVMLCTLPAARASAHELGLAELELRELEQHHFAWRWSRGEGGGRARPDLEPRWPRGCAVQDRTLHCPERGLIGPFSIAGVGETHSAVLVRIALRGGEQRIYTLTAAQPSVYLESGENARATLDVARVYTLLGIEHILTGIDHLAFVVGLLFLVGFQRKLVLTITAFTLAHSVTLAGSVLGLIAVFVHGAGFAGALRDAGLPEQSLPLALFTFNVGVEVGQLLAVACAFAFSRACARLNVQSALRTPALYTIGAAAAYACFQRLLTLGAP